MNQVFQNANGQNGFTNVRFFNNGNPVNMQSQHSFNSQPQQTQQSNTTQQPNTIHKTLSITLEQSYKGVSIPMNIIKSLQEGPTLRETEETIYVDIPKGIDSNEVIVLKGNGNEIDGQKGDIRIKIEVEKHELFERNGLDLSLTKHITLSEALCGFKMSFTYLDGKTTNITNAEETIITPTFKQRIPNMGMKRGSMSGALDINFKIAFPQKITKDQRMQLKQILDNCQ